MLVRREALADLDHAFDEDLSCGEDVDLVWRLLDAGWTVRYEPNAQVHRHEPARWQGLLRRRWFYGTSVAGLALRQPQRVGHLRASPVATGTLGALMTGHPVLASGVAGIAVARLAPRLRRLGAPGGTAVGMTTQLGAVGGDRARAGDDHARVAGPGRAGEPIAPPRGRRGRRRPRSAAAPVVAAPST